MPKCGPISSTIWKGDRQAGAVLPGPVERRPDRGDARRPPAHRRLQHRLEPAGGRLRRLPPLRDDGLRGRLLRLRDGDHHLSRLGIERVEDIKGRTWPSPRRPRTPASRRPRRCCKAEYGMEAGATSPRPSPARTTTRSSAWRTRTTTPPPSPTRCKARMIERDVVKPDQLVTIYKSETFPTTGYGVAHNLAPELQEKIREAFFSFDWEGTPAGGVLQVRRGAVHPDHLPGKLGGDPRDRRGHGRLLRCS
jgi:hypothetical protein